MQRKPHRFSDYVTTHEEVMEHLRSTGFVGEDTLTWTTEVAAVRLHGEIACQGNIVIRVDKTLSIVEGTGATARVLGQLYAYNVHLRNGPNIFRYDNTHPHAGHADAYHKHVYELLGAVEGRVQWTGRGAWPRLGDVIEEVRVWRDANVDRLERPDAFPELDVRGL